MKALEILEEKRGIATLCGSTRFFDVYREAAKELCHRGWMTFECGAYGHSYHKDRKFALTHKQHVAIKRLHFRKLAMSRLAVICTDNTGYIGDSTKAEYFYCQHINIPVIYFDGNVFTTDRAYYEYTDIWVDYSLPRLVDSPLFDSDLDHFLEGLTTRGWQTGILTESEWLQQNP